jgi:nucleoid-associated protein YgaU
MMGFNTFRAKDPVLAVILSMGLVFAAPAMSKAQQGDWEEVGPAGHSAQQLMSAPPRVVAPALGQTSYRPPVEPPANVSSNAGVAAANHATQSHYVVQAGDTLPKIAMKVFGDANRWQDLMVLNNIENGNRIFVGQKLITAASNSSAAPAIQAATQNFQQHANNAQQYAANQLQRSQANVQQAQSQARKVQQQAQKTQNQVQQQASQFNEADYEVAANIIEETAVSSVSADADADASFYGQTGGSYVIKNGDTLGTIAKRLLGSSQKWREIARANPTINPNKLMVGETLVIPGAVPTQHEMGIPSVEARPLSSQPWQSAMAAPPAQQYQPQQPAMSAPSFDPPPLMAPPPPPSNYAPYGAPPAPSAMDAYAPPAAPPVYSGGGMTPPPPPVSVPNIMEPPAAPYMSAPVPGPAPAPGMPVAVSTRDLYREERFRIPDELKPTDYTPYFVNFNGYHGLFETECALLPYLSTWNFGVQMKYENYRYLNGEKGIVDEGYELVVPVHLTYSGKKFFAGMTIPFQNWEVKDGVNSADLSGLHDPSLKVGYQVWKNLDGDHAVTVHAEGKFPGGNYNRPQQEIGTVADGTTKTGSVMGPAGATRGAEVQVGGAYSGRLNEKWASHLNMALANNPEDNITKLILRGGLDYRVNRHFAIIGELTSTSYDIDNRDQLIYINTPTPGLPADNKTAGTNVDMVVGFTLFNDRWQGNLAFPVALQKEFGYGHDFGVIFGVNHRWD